MDFEQARFNMVEQQIRPWDVLDMDVLDTLMQVKRELFVPPAYRLVAFSDTEIPLAAGQAMLAPKIEAKALQALAPREGDSALEIGTGSGFMAALLAVRCEWVRSVEIEPELLGFALDNLKRAGVENVIVEEGDGAAGWSARAPYDLIMVSGALPEIPAAMLSQLKPGGRLFAFVGEAPVMVGQLVRCVGEGQFEKTSLFETVVPPLRLPRAVAHFEF